MRLRRRLSRIFQREITGSVLATVLPRGVRNRAPQPARDLPVAAHPPVLPRGVGEVAAGIVVDEVDVGDEAGARVEPFEQVVAEERVLRHAPGERGLERVDVVDALADVAALVKHVLVEIGHGRRVGIDADVPGEHAGEHRPVGADDADADARLQDAVAFGDALEAGIEARPVQRMRQRADQPPAGFHRQLRVGVERDHVADGRQNRRLAVLDDEARVGRAAQQAVELGQLAALALGPHPAALARRSTAARGERRRSDRHRDARSARRRAGAPPRRARRRRAASAASASAKSESSAKCRCASRLAKNRTSRSSRSDVRRASESMIAGTATIVRSDGGDARPHVELGQLPRADLRRDDEVDQADGQLAQRQQHHERRDPEIARVAARAGARRRRSWPRRAPSDRRSCRGSRGPDGRRRSARSGRAASAGIPLPVRAGSARARSGSSRRDACGPGRERPLRAAARSTARRATSCSDALRRRASCSTEWR